ncbi:MULTISPECIES: hypothetical protein [Xanthomonas]|uniref:hypothetical protein n=1 Tax=Xanthomonas TaxID=338 RepID=UPI001ADB5354|nr:MULTISPECIES: hypothetical protein [unclassified Xanthomonas]MBO9871864.1 hypothetical protein [Xanthomonas sp. D-93]WNH43223.1 hypothetical protein PG878_11770 [Xanthomonas sp. A6251]
MSWAAEALGLPPDADARAIKRAYALRLKTTRPDDDPVAFQQLYETYQAALARAQAEAETATSPDRDGARVEDADVGTAPRLAAAPWVEEAQVRPRPRPRAEAVHDLALEAELAQWQDDAYAQERAARIVAAAQTLPAATFGAWLRALPELWSLEMRPRIGQAIATEVIRAGLTISDAVVDVLIDCFSDESDNDLREALWTGRVLAIALEQSPDFLSHWLSKRDAALSDIRAAIGVRVLRALREQHEQHTSLHLETIDTLSKAFLWKQLDHDHHDRAWLYNVTETARIKERTRRRLAELTPDGDAALLAYELDAVHGQKTTPCQAARLRAYVVGPASRWHCLLFALLPPRPTRMYHICDIIDRWFPGGLPAAIEPRHMRFWKQLGDRRRPHGWQLVVDLARMLVVAPVLALVAVLLLPSAVTVDIAAFFGALPTALAICSAVVLTQMAARWQARTTLANWSKRIAHFWALPAASAVVLTWIRSGAWDTITGVVLAYVAAWRMIGRLEDAESRRTVVPGLAALGVAGALVVLTVQAGPWPGIMFASLLWAISFIQDTQRQAMQGQR